jgi:ADP-heptose:LPS heptosyltransferase
MRILVIRNSAMGDVAMVGPVMKALHIQFPKVEILLLTRAAFHPFFESMPKVELFSPDYLKRHKGIFGIHRLYQDIMATGPIDYVIDLHDVVRSKVLRSFFNAKGIPVSVIQKGRKEKKDLVKSTDKTPLKHTVLRYAEAFSEAGFPVNPNTETTISIGEDQKKIAATILNSPSTLKIGIAPLAKHSLKIWPEQKMLALMKLISQKGDCSFYLFGDKNEAPSLDRIAKEVNGTINLAGKYSLQQELAIMSQLNFMIAMDSANMHMASLVGTKVISIWGATDPIAGFGAWGQPEDYAVKISFSELPCRPCTVYGKGACSRKDFACMNQLEPERVLQVLEAHQLLS